MEPSNKIVTGFTVGINNKLMSVEKTTMIKREVKAEQKKANTCRKVLETKSRNETEVKTVKQPKPKPMYGILNFFNFQPASTLIQSEITTQFESLKPTAMSDFSCFQSYESWTKMLTAYNKLLSQVQQAIYGEMDTASSEYGALPVDFLKCLNCLFGSKQTPTKFYSTFTPA